MRKNQNRFTAAVLLSVFLFMFLVGAGQKFLKPVTPSVPAEGKSIVRLTKDNGENRRESKGFFRRKERVNKDEHITGEPDGELVKDLAPDKRLRRDNGENRREYNNRGGKCPQFNTEECE